MRVPGFNEHRVCEDCRKPYTLPIPYEQANPQIRDKCLDCIKAMQRDHETTDEPAKVKDEWY